MGCNSSKDKREGNSHALNGSTASGAEEFVKVARENPVAAKLKEEWSNFVKSFSASAPAEARREVWANTRNDPVTHRSVDHVGKLFLAYVKNELTLRDWAGDFNYTVVGEAKEGFVCATAIIDASRTNIRAREALWEAKVHYHSKPQVS